VRVRRRLAELREGDPAISEADVARELAERDARDLRRTHSPLIAAADAVEVDTTERSIDEVVASLLAAIGPPG
jgi:cytidylate kinase